MTNTEKEALDFLKDFETSTRNYLLHRGMTDSEVPGALLEAQWQLLNCILKSKLGVAKRQRNTRRTAKQPRHNVI